MTRAYDPERRTLRSAALGGLGFSVLFLAHHLLQGTGPPSSSAADVAAYDVAHSGALLGSEVALAFGLLAFIGFLAPLTVAVRRAGEETLAVALLVAGVLFLALGFVSTAAETALVRVADSGQPGAVDALQQLQGRTPVVWAVAALAAALSLAVRRTGLLWRGLGTAGLVLAVVFLLAGVSSLLGREVEGGYSLVGVGLFIVWMLLVSAGLWRRSPAAPVRPGGAPD
ncbi:hypothetical protein MRQ36_22360 [Micromonospora sp. R77]|uniref:hypothetical protein n=1 Tax=Micromonospora sp. R77 TaxID=2925836 RepID=UPI001F622A2B|nr:hypothetical protein [Micromonospora sp. R77]MCI4065160.1 hypothetical protein [Micromonospora sp. R77]